MRIKINQVESFIKSNEVLRGSWETQRHLGKNDEKKMMRGLKGRPEANGKVNISKGVSARRSCLG